MRTLEPWAETDKQSSTYNYQPKPLPKKVQEQVNAAAATSTPWDDSEGHYIIKPDDVVGGRCTWRATLWQDR